MWARPAVQKGASVPDPYKFRDVFKDPKEMERMQNAGREIVQAGMKADREINQKRTESKV